MSIAIRQLPRVVCNPALVFDYSAAPGACQTRRTARL